MQTLTKTIERDFNKEAFAKKYIEHHQSYNQLLGRKIAKALTQMGVDGHHILDAGCGFGGVDFTLLEELPNVQITGLDLSNTLITYACQEIESPDNDQLYGRVRFVLGDVQQIPFEADTFDCVISANVLHLVDRPIQMLNEIERVLKPDGKLYLINIRYSNILGLLDKVFNETYPIAMVKNLIARSNLREGSFKTEAMYWSWSYTVI